MVRPPVIVAVLARRLVEVTLVVLTPAGLNDATDRLLKNALVDVIEVPLAVVNLSALANRLVEVAFVPLALVNINKPVLVTFPVLILEGLKLVADRVVKNALVEVIDVPFNLVNEMLVEVT